LLDLGYVAFYALGAYGYALANQLWGLSFWWGLPVSALVAAVAALLVGLPVLRLRGDYLAIVTLGFAEMVRLALINWQSVTGGPAGLGGIARPTLFGISFSNSPNADQIAFHEWLGIEFSSLQRIIFLYLIILLLVSLIYLALRRLRRLPLGLAWEAVREDEVAAVSLGLNVTRLRLAAYMLGASLAGMAGCFFAARQGFISPESFTFNESALVLAVVVLGGLGSQAVSATCACTSASGSATSGRCRRVMSSTRRISSRKLATRGPPSSEVTPGSASCPASATSPTYPG
jgi:branched-chain amino acid transport system permease protein